ncbi:MAG: UDP-N-acetylmuramate--L-alanine ligase [Alphaproteobacteria bacterium]|nr:UDP-N-acetylmuramate--L-alanine ligase [Alphaproteobacteria bacterium]
MTNSPQAIGIIHFIGIGGIGMSGIAEVLHNIGYKVQGSDLSDGPNIQRLEKIGIPIFIGHKASQITDVEVVVISSDVPNTNPELIEARARLIPVVRRAEMLGELMRFKSAIAVAGTHGKTTTTSLVASLLETAKMDPTVVNGGIINSYNTNARLGTGEWMVVEADESDGSFLKLPATIAVITNIDPEHMNYYGTFDNLKLAFENFILNIPFYGFGVLCLDHPVVQSIIPHVSERRLITYGTNPQANVRAHNIQLQPEGARFDVEIMTRKLKSPKHLKNIFLPMMGHHNVLNSLVPIAIGHELGLADDVIIEGLAQFKGVKRRFTKTGHVDGITIIDDYGHHPVEIKAVLKAGRQATKNKIIAVFQPHRYTRVESLFEEFCSAFNDADIVIVSDVYAAREDAIPGISKESLVAGLRQHGHRQVISLPNPHHLPEIVHSMAQKGDYVICLGAGDVTKWAYALPEALEKIRSTTQLQEAYV